ncbi:hypothetical protein ACPB4A_27125, partial [Escherichia coli]
ISYFVEFFNRNKEIDASTIFNVDKLSHEQLNFLKFKTCIINTAAKEAATNFCANLSLLLDGTDNIELIEENTDIHKILDE